MTEQKRVARALEDANDEREQPDWEWLAEVAIEVYKAHLEEQGLVVVPHNPSITMTDVGEESLGSGARSWAIWQAMIEAAEKSDI